MAQARSVAERLSTETVQQVTDKGEVVALHKEVHRIRGEVPLSLVRKHLPGGPTRPPVLLVHGFAQNRYSWHTSQRSMSAWLAEQGWDTWNLELRGHGRSRPTEDDHAAPRPRNQGAGAEVFADYVDDVLRAAGVLPEPAFWVGHSLGGTALIGAATQVQGRGVLTPAPRGVVGIGALYAFAQKNKLIRALCLASHALRDTPWMQPAHVRTRLVGKLLSRIYAISDVAGYTFPVSGWWPGSVEPELLAERLQRGFDWTSVRVWQEMSRWGAEDQFEYDADWARTDLPLLVMLGDEDHLMPPEDGRRAFDRSGSSDRTLRVFDDWHDEVHWGHLDLILGRFASAHVWPAVHDWMAERG